MTIPTIPTIPTIASTDGLVMPGPASIQNSYSLLCRSFEGSSGLAEACAPQHHNVGLLPWSVLCGGLLSGKYATPEDQVDLEVKIRDLEVKYICQCCLGI